MPNACTSAGFSQIRPQLGALDHVPRRKAYGERCDDHPRAILREEHEAEVDPAGERLRHLVGQPGRAELVAEKPLDDQRQPECQQQAVEVIELVQACEHRPFDDDTENADGNRREQKRPPVAEAEVLQQEPCAESSHHVLRAVSKVDDVEQPEDHGEPERKHRVKRPVDQPDQELAEQRLRRDAEDFSHA
jgi:hypothetical protein